MSETVRISPETARQRVLDGQSLLVCAYPGDEKFQKYHLEGAVSFSDFQAQENETAKDQEIIFY